MGPWASSVPQNPVEEISLASSFSNWRNRYSMEMKMAAARSLSLQKLFPLLTPAALRMSVSFPHAFLPSSFCASSFSYPRKSPYITHAKKRGYQLEPVQKITSTQEEGEEDISPEGEEEYISDFEDGAFEEGDDYSEDELEEEDSELSDGDGTGGGGILLAGTWWDKKALAIAEEVSQSLDGNFSIYSFKTSTSATIHIRIEKLSNKYGSPSLNDIEVFTSAYRARLDEAEVARAIPENISLEVSSPGVERLVRVPQDLDRFKYRPMYVRYVTDAAATGSSQVNDGVFKLVSFDLESRYCTWSLADVRINREQRGKGKPLSKKQREWRLQLPFYSLRLVRLHSEF